MYTFVFTLLTWWNVFWRCWICIWGKFNKNVYRPLRFSLSSL